MGLAERPLVTVRLLDYIRSIAVNELAEGHKCPPLTPSVNGNSAITGGGTATDSHRVPVC